MERETILQKIMSPFNLLIHNMRVKKLKKILGYYGLKNLPDNFLEEIIEKFD